MHGPAAALAVAGGLSVELGEHRTKLGTLGNGMTMTAMGGGHLVGVSEDRHHARGNGLLADVEVKEAGHVAGLDQLAGVLLEQTDAHHRAVQLENQLTADVVGVSLARAVLDARGSGFRHSEAPHSYRKQTIVSTT